MSLDLPELDTDQDEPLHQSVKRVIEEIAAQPTYMNGENPLPPETEIARQLGVSRGTVRRAIAVLVDEGRLERKRGSGTWVRGHRVQTQLEAWYSFSGEMQSRSLPFELLEWTSQREKTSRRAAEALGVRTGRVVWTLHRLIGIGEMPTVDFVSWFEPEVDLSEFDPTTTRLYTYLEEYCGKRPTRSEEAITARTADADYADRLDVKEGAALLIRRRRVCDSEDRPVEYNVGVYRADQFEYTVQLERT